MAAAVGKPVDLELKQAFAELQLKMIDTNQKIKFTDVQIESLKRSIMHKQITDKEIAKLPEETKVYEGVGRCFFVSSIPEVRKNLTKTLSEFNDKIKTFESGKEILEKEYKSNENAVRELVNQKKK